MKNEEVINNLFILKKSASSNKNLQVLLKNKRQVGGLALLQNYNSIIAFYMYYIDNKNDFIKKLVINSSYLHYSKTTQTIINKTINTAKINDIDIVYLELTKEDEINLKYAE